MLAWAAGASEWLRLRLRLHSVAATTATRLTARTREQSDGSIHNSSVVPCAAAAHSTTTASHFRRP
jgi:hypothetical protein